MGRKTNPREGGMETPPDAEAIARAFMEEELAKDRPKPVAEAALPGAAASEQSIVANPESQSPGASSQAEVDAYIAGLDAQVADGNLLTPFTKPNKRRAEELSRSFDLPADQSQSMPSTPANPDTNRASETQPPVVVEAVSAETEPFKFVFPRLGQDKSVHYQAADGSVYEIMKKPGGYRITKEGDPAIASISRTEIMKRGQAEHWVAADSDKSDTSSLPSTPEAAVSASLSPEALERQRQAFTDLQEQADHWRRKIADVKNKKEFDALTSSAAVNGKWTADTGPGFVVGKALRDVLMKNPDIQSDTEIEAVREQARVLQAELTVLYLAKRAKMYPSRGSVSTTATASVPDVAPKSPEQRAELGLMVGEVWSAEEDGHDVEIEILEFFDGPAKAGNARMVRIRRTMAGPRRNENLRMEIPLYKLAERLKSYTKKREAPKPAERVEPSLESSVSPIEAAAAVEVVGAVSSVSAEARDSTVPEKDVPPLGPAAEQAGSPILPIPGEKIRYRRKDGSDVWVETEGRTGNYIYRVTDENGFVTADADSLAERAVKEGWQLVEKTSSSFESPTPPPEVAAGTTVGDIDREIIKLREEVASERAAFIAVEESQRSAWKNLTRIFRGLSHKDSDDAEVMKYRAFYDEKVLALQNAELEKLKRSGKTVKELRPEMAALIREFEFDEAERVYAARQEMRLAKTNQPLLEKMKALWADAKEGIDGPTAKGEVKAWIKLFAGATGAVGSSAIQGIEKGGAAYNKLMRSKAGKYILAASLVGAGAGIAAGGLGVAAGAFALKRLAAGAGVAVTLEDVSERIARARREKRRANVEQDHEVRFDAMESEEDLEIKLGNKQEIDFSKLEKYLKEVSAKTRKGEGARRRNELFRKSGAIFAGAVLGSGAAAHFANEYIGGASRAHAASAIARNTAGEAIVTTNMSFEQAAAVSNEMKEGSLSSDMALGQPAAMTPPLVGTVAPAEKVTVLSEKAVEFLSAHKVAGRESIWKLATKAIEDVPGMDDRASGRFAKLVELRLAEKLEANPELARSAGFVADADGKFSPQHIQAGAKLELGKLLSQDELAKLIEEAKGESPISTPSVAVPDTPIRETVTPTSSPALSEAEMAAREEASIAERIPPVSPDERSAILATFPESPTTELIKPDGNVMKYIESLSKEDQEKLFRNFKKISVELFQTNDVMGGEVNDMRYDPAVHPELVKTKLAAVITDHKLLAKNPLVGYDRLKNPLHWSQMEEVAKFAQASAKAFGASVAEPKTTESVQEYALRMIAIARNQGVKIPGFRMLD